MRPLFVGLLATSLALSPTASMASAPAAASLSVQRAAPQLQDANAVEGENSWLWIGLGAVVLLAFILIVIDDDDDDLPDSP